MRNSDLSSDVCSSDLGRVVVLKLELQLFLLGVAGVGVPRPRLEARARPHGAGRVGVLPARDAANLQRLKEVTAGEVNHALVNGEQIGRASRRERWCP